MVNPKYLIEDRETPKAIEILKSNGFREILRMPRLCLYDFEALDSSGKPVYIEFRFRSPDKAPLFVFKKSKLARLRELRERTGREVYLLLLWGERYKLTTLDNLDEDLKPFKLFITGKDNLSFRFPLEGELREEEKTKIKELFEKGVKLKDIAQEVGRCTPTIAHFLEREGLRVSRRTSHRKKTMVIHIRARESTFREWQKLLYHWKMFGWDAEKLLSEMIAYFQSKPKGQVL
jgi:hypothetical protein